MQNRFLRLLLAMTYTIVFSFAGSIAFAGSTSSNTNAESSEAHFYLIDQVFETDASLMTYKGIDVERYAWYLAVPVIVAAKAGALLMTPGGQWSAAAITAMYVPKAIPLQIAKTMGRLKLEAMARAQKQLAAIESLPGAEVLETLRLEGVETTIEHAITTSIKMKSIYIIKTSKALPANYEAKLPLNNKDVVTAKFTEIADLNSAKLSFIYSSKSETENQRVQPYSVALSSMLEGVRMSREMNLNWRTAYAADEKNNVHSSAVLKIQVNNAEISLGTFVGHHGMNKFLGLGWWEKSKLFFRKTFSKKGTEVLEGEKLILKSFSKHNENDAGYSFTEMGMPL